VAGAEGRAEPGGGAVSAVEIGAGVGTAIAPSKSRSPSDRVADAMLRGWGVFVYVFLYAPIVVVVIYAFNDNRLVEVWNGFGLHYWASTWADPEVRSALILSLWTASANAVIATVLGTAAALALRNVGRRTRTVYDGFMYTAIIVPEIVIAIASLLFL